LEVLETNGAGLVVNLLWRSGNGQRSVVLLLFVRLLTEKGGNKMKKERQSRRKGKRKRDGLVFNKRNLPSDVRPHDALLSVATVAATKQKRRGEAEIQTSFAIGELVSDNRDRCEGNDKIEAKKE
jgi:hypothetical protein